MSEQPRVGLAISALSLGTALNPLNSSMVAVALVAFRDDFDLSVTSVTWVITTFYLASMAFQPLMGRLADRFGPKLLFLTGMGLVAVTCVVAGFSPNFALVCVGRAFMAVGTATAFPCAVSMVTGLTRQAGISSTRPLGAIQMANASGAAVGPVLGGVLVTLFGWQPLFFVNVPLAIVSFVAVLLVAPADAPRQRQSLSRTMNESDIPGIAAFIGALVALMIVVLDALPAYRWPLLAAGIVLGALFVWRELRFRSPFLDLRLLAGNRPLITIFVSFAIFTAVFYSAFYGLPQLLEEFAGYSTDQVGLLMLPMAAISVVATPLATRAIDRWGVRRMLILGTAGVLVAASALWLLTASTAVAVVLVLTAALGLPYGVSNITFSQGMYASARPEDRGTAAGLFQTFRYLGAIGATGLVGVGFSSGVNPANRGMIVPVMLSLAALTIVGSALWRPAREKA